MTKKWFIYVLVMVAVWSTYIWYVDYSVKKFENELITEMTENFKEETKEQHHEMRLHMTQEQLWLTYQVDRAIFDSDESYDNGMLLIDDLNIMQNRCHNGWYEIDGERYVSEEFLNTLAWNVHDIVTYGETFR